jgi:nucleotide-binding universal stress UspA family protein
MSYASILTHFAAEPEAEARLMLAADLANQFDAALIGVGAEFFEPPSIAQSVGYVDGETLVAEATAVRDDLQRAKVRFLEIGKTVRAGSDWRAGVGLPWELVAEEARAADLIVCGQDRPDRWGLHNHANPGDVLMLAGRPVLIAPAKLAKIDASSVLVAWKDTRESRRAVLDAMPFLTRAKQVLIAEVCERADEEDARSRTADVAEYLGRHGVKCSTAVRECGHGQPSAALLQMAAMQDAGLIVAGGYGHARFREWVFGGVTRDLLAGATRAAVLLSH